MENVVFTQLSIPEVRRLFREELQSYFANKPIAAETADADEIDGIELAEKVTGLKIPTIYALVSKREIPHFKRGKRLYFSKRELINWLQSGKRKTQSEIAAEAANSTNNQNRQRN
jgi:predicted DNA-binding transcriptional regulator AlpA